MKEFYFSHIPTSISRALTGFSASGGVIYHQLSFVDLPERLKNDIFAQFNFCSIRVKRSAVF